MFTGIVEEIGRVVRVELRGDKRVRISMPWDPEAIDIGSSVSCDGICLTVVDRGGDSGGNWFEVDLSAETVSRTVNASKSQAWVAGSRINLERALKVGDELGGHIVSGHVDGVASVSDIRDEGDSLKMTFDAAPELVRFIAPKGSICLNGTSLTVNWVGNACFGVNLIPHTLAVTTWSDIAQGDDVNVEVDLIARYVAQLLEARQDR